MNKIPTELTRQHFFLHNLTVIKSFVRMIYQFFHIICEDSRNTVGFLVKYLHAIKYNLLLFSVVYNHFKWKSASAF